MLVVLLLLAASAALFLLWPRPPAAAAVITVGYGEAQTTRRLPLAGDETVEIDAALPVQLEVQDGAIRFIGSTCPDHLCEQAGWLRHTGDWAACMPAGVMVRVEEAPSPVS